MAFSSDLASGYSLSSLDSKPSAVLFGSSESQINPGLIAKRINDLSAFECNSELSSAAGKICFTSLIDDLIPENQYQNQHNDFNKRTRETSLKGDDIGLYKSKSKRKTDSDTVPGGGFEEDKMLFVGVNCATLVDLVTKSPIMSFHHLRITHVAISRDGYLAITGGHGKVRVWNSSTGHRILKISSLWDGANPVSISPSQDHFLVGNKLSTKALNLSFTNGSSFPKASVSISNLIPTYDIFMIRFYHTTNLESRLLNEEKIYTFNEEIIDLKGHVDVINSIKHSSLSTLAVSGSRDGTVRVWNLLNCSCLQSLNLIEASSEEKKFEGIEESYSEDFVSIEHRISHANISVDMVDIISDGKFVMGSSMNAGLAKVWSTSDGSCIACFSCSPIQILDISLGLDGKYFVLCLSNESIQVHSLKKKQDLEETGVFVTSYPGKQLSKVTSDGSKILGCYGERSLIYYKVPTYLWSSIPEPVTLPEYLLPAKSDLFVEED